MNTVKPLLIWIVIKLMLETVKTAILAKGDQLTKSFYYLDDNYDRDSDSLYMIENTERKIKRVDFSGFDRVNADTIKIYDIVNGDEKRFTHIFPLYHSTGHKYLITCGRTKTGLTEGYVSISRLYENDTMILLQERKYSLANLVVADVTAIKANDYYCVFCYAYRANTDSRIRCFKFEFSSKQITKFANTPILSNRLIKQIIFTSEVNIVGIYDDGKVSIFEIDFSTTAVSETYYRPGGFMNGMAEFRPPITGFDNLFLSIEGTSSKLYKIGGSSFIDEVEQSLTQQITYIKWIKPTTSVVIHQHSGKTRIYKLIKDSTQMKFQELLSETISGFKENAVYLYRSNIFISFENRKAGTVIIHWAKFECPSNSGVYGHPCYPTCKKGYKTTLQGVCAENINEYDGCRILTAIGDCYECENNLHFPFPLANIYATCKGCKPGFIDNSTSYGGVCQRKCDYNREGKFRLKKDSLLKLEYCVSILDQKCERTQNYVEDEVCEKCKNGFDLVSQDDGSKICLTSCLADEYRPSGSNDCKKCSELLEGCSSCPGGVCNQCALGYFKNQSTTFKCQKVCPENNFLDPQNNCKQIIDMDADCLEAKNFTFVCTRCQGTYELINESSQPIHQLKEGGKVRCKKVCKSGEYLKDDQKTCASCSSGCKECSNKGGNQERCDVCDQGRFKDPSGKCVLITELDEDCNKADDNNYLCTGCVSGFVVLEQIKQNEKQLKGGVRCIKVCKKEEGKYLLNDQKTCGSCSSGCKTCENDGSDGDKCLTCDNSSLFVGGDHKCHKITDLDPECLQAVGNSFECSKCEIGYEKLTDQDKTKLKGSVRCKRQCGEKKYLLKNLKTCKTCSEGCAQCYNNGNDGDKCSKCLTDKLRFRDPDHQCHLVSKLDKDCISASDLSFKCSDCNQGFKVSKEQKTSGFDPKVRCIKKCKEKGEYLLKSQKECETCSEGCAQCYNDGNDGDKCSQCLTDQPRFRDPDLQCHLVSKLDRDCTSGEDESFECLTCKQGFRVSKEQNKNKFDKKVRCIKKCKEKGEYLLKDLKTCKPCPENCERCQRDEKDDPICLSCSNNYWLNETSIFCQKQCRNETSYFSLEKNECFTCQENCLRCSNNTADCSLCSKSHMVNFSLPTSCYEFTSDIKIKNKYFDKKSKTLGINFNKKIKINNSSLIKVTHDSKEMKVESIEVKENNLKIKLNISQSVNKATLEIKSSLNITIEDSEINHDYFVDYPIIFSDISYYVNDNDESLKAAGKVGAVTVSATTGIMMIFSYSVALILIKIFQIVDFLVYINVDLPSNVQSFLSFFDQNFFNIIPNLITLEESQLTCSPHEIFLQEEFDCYILNSSGSQLGQLFIFFFIKLIFYILMKTYIKNYYKKRKESKELIVGKEPFMIRAIQGIYNFYSVEFFFAFSFGIQIDVLMGAMINLRYNFKLNTFVSAFNTLLSIAVILSYILINFFLLKKILKLNNIKKDTEIARTHYKSKMKDWLFLKNEFKEEKKFAKYFIGVNMIKDTLVPIIVVLFVDIPSLQMVSLCICLALTFIFIVFTFPYKSVMENIVISLNLLLYFIVMILFLILNSKKNSWDEEKKYKSLGNLINIFIALILFLNVFSALIIVILMLKKMYDEKNNKRRTRSFISKKIQDDMRERIRREAEGQKRRRERKERREKERRDNGVDGEDIDPDNSRANIFIDQRIEDLKNFDGGRVDRVINEMVRDNEERDRRSKKEKIIGKRRLGEKNKLSVNKRREEELNNNKRDIDSKNRERKREKEKRGKKRKRIDSKNSGRLRGKKRNQFKFE